MRKRGQDSSRVLSPFPLRLLASKRESTSARRRTTMARNTCEHVKQIRPVTPNSEGCEECLATGDRWVHLRLCLTCGHVGCCDSSKNKHATKHFHASGHPVMKSAEPGEDWGWCYIDEIQLDSV